MYLWNPRLFDYQKEKENYESLDIDKWIPQIPKATGHRRYKPEGRRVVDRSQAISEIIDEYVPAPDNSRIVELLRPVPKPYQKKVLITEAEVPGLCTCCNRINQANLRQINRHPGPVPERPTHVAKSVPQPKVGSYSLAPPTQITDTQQRRPGGVLVTERAMVNPHGLTHYDYHEINSHSLTHWEPTARLHNLELNDAEERFMVAENRLQAYARNTSSPELPRKVQFPNGKLSVRFSTVPMRYIYTPPRYH